MGNHGGPWGTVGDRGNQLEPAGTLESQPGVLDDGMQNSALGCMISRLYQCFSFVAREFRPRNDQTPRYEVQRYSTVIYPPADLGWEGRRRRKAGSQLRSCAAGFRAPWGVIKSRTVPGASTNQETHDDPSSLRITQCA